VIILGAGAAGLAAAKTLSDEGCSSLILEARDRIGGRILTLKDRPDSLPIDLGAEFIHGRPDATWRLIHDAKLIAHDVPFDHHQRRGRQLIHLESFTDELGKIMNGLPTGRAPDVSFAEYLQKHRRDPRYASARRLATHFVQGFDAADPNRVSAKSIAQEWQGIGDMEDEPQFRIVGGQMGLIDHLHRSLDRELVQIRLKMPVSEISWRRSKVEIRCGRGGRECLFTAPRLIVTLPLGILQLPPDTTGSIRLSPEIPQKRNAASKLGSGPVVKAVMRFREPFWEDKRVGKAAGASDGLEKAVFLHGFDLPFPTFWTSLPLRVPVLTAWAGGPKARALAGLGDAAIAEAALASLAALLNVRRSRVDPMLEKIRVYDWLSDPFARGAYSYVSVGSERARTMLAKPIDNTLFFAGEATDTSGQASTVAGALASGERAAREVLASL
jgi:monoamine oxidase